MPGARLLAVLATLAALAAAAAACGVGPGEPRRGGVELRLTRDFGQRLLHAAARDGVREGDTVMSLLSSEARVKTAYGGGFVHSIDGLEGRGAGGADDWFYFVNGLEGDVGAGERRLAPGDVVQWDHRPWSGAMSVPAIVGAFPEPLASGSQGRRLPVRLECADERGRACAEAGRRLAAAGVTASRASFGEAAGETIVRVVVAPWAAARRGAAAAKLERGPQASGVFARFGQGGRRLELLDAMGRRALTASPGSGLVAAMAVQGRQQVWLVTGTDVDGVERAATALDRAKLRDRYAVAALPRRVVPLPLLPKEEGAR